MQAGPVCGMEPKARVETERLTPKSPGEGKSNKEGITLTTLRASLQDNEKGPPCSPNSPAAFLISS